MCVVRGEEEVLRGTIGGVVGRGCVCCSRCRGVMSRYGCFVLIVLVNICHLAPHVNAGCAVQEDRVNIASLKEELTAALDRSVMRILDDLYGSWAAHTVPVTWAKEDGATSVMGRTNFTSRSSRLTPRHASTNRPMTMEPEDWKAIQTQINRVYSTCGRRSNECLAYVRWLAETYQRHLSVSDKTENIFTEDKTLNMVIAGGGPVGLYLANAIATAFPSSVVRIVVVENRVFQNGTKRPYARQWPTDISFNLLEASLDPRLLQVFRSLSVRCYSTDCHLYINDHDSNPRHKYTLRTEINVMETLLLLSCRSKGVRFLYRETPDYTCNNDGGNTDIGKLVCQAHLKVDATGNRMRPFDKRAFIESNHWSNMDMRAMSYRLPGFYSPPHSDTVFFMPKVVWQDRFLFPLAPHGGAYILSYLKILHLPYEFKAALNVTAGLCPWETCGQMYVWDGPGELTMFINLRSDEVNLLARLIDDQVRGTALDDRFMESMVRAKRDGVRIDPNLMRALETIFLGCKLREIPECSKVRVAGPYEMNPYVVYKNSNIAQHDLPIVQEDESWVRVGDSLFQGDFTLGTGLGYHFAIVGSSIMNTKEVVAKNTRRYHVCT